MKNQRELFEALLNKKVLINADGTEIALFDSSGMVGRVDGIFDNFNFLDYREWKIVKDTGFIVVNDKLVPHPITDINSKLLHEGVKCFYPTIDKENIVSSFIFSDLNPQTQLVEKGLVHLSEQDALDHAKALLKNRYAEFI